MTFSIIASAYQDGMTQLSTDNEMMNANLLLMLHRLIYIKVAKKLFSQSSPRKKNQEIVSKLTEFYAIREFEPPYLRKTSRIKSFTF